MHRSIATLTAAALLLAGCAKKAEEVQPAYVSPLQYQSYDCEQLELEMERIKSRLYEVAQIQDKEHKKDVVATTVGLVIFWPALFLLAGGDKEQELARLKGEYEAIQRAAIAKRCTFIDTNASR